MVKRQEIQQWPAFYCHNFDFRRQKNCVKNQKKSKKWKTEICINFQTKKNRWKFSIKLFSKNFLSKFSFHIFSKILVKIFNEYFRQIFQSKFLVKISSQKFQSKFSDKKIKIKFPVNILVTIFGENFQSIFFQILPDFFDEIYLTKILRQNLSYIFC